MNKFPIFSGKGSTLHNLSSILTQFHVPELIILSVKQLKDLSYEDLREHLERQLGSSLIAVRSACTLEDNAIQSYAGAFESVLGVDIQNASQLTGAIERVIQSFEKYASTSFIVEEQSIIFQKQVVDVLLSGVLFTRQLNNGAPYYCINYDDISGKTDTVTSGSGIHSNKTVYVYRNYSATSLKSPRLKRIMTAVKELEQVVGSSKLDVEFALTKDLQPILFQVRPMTVSHDNEVEVDYQFEAEIPRVKSFLEAALSVEKGILGSKTIYGVMPDWNPIEMIGKAPAPLSYELYKELITFDVWSKARYQMGYKCKNIQNLMLKIAGQPFINVVKSFNSFIPESVDDDIARRLIDYWVDSLISNPSLHDKIEFDVAVTAFDLNISAHIERLCPNVLSDAEKTTYITCLKDQFRKLQSPNDIGSLQSALKENLPFNNIENYQDLELNELIDFTKKHGTLPFSIAARHAFIASRIIKSLQELDIFSKSDVEQFNLSIQTITSEYLSDISKIGIEYSWSEIIKKYGHLRPGSYDITAPNYEEMWDKVKLTHVAKNQNFVFSLTKQKVEDINQLLLEHELSDIFTAHSLLEYCKAAIQAREKVKFEFSKGLNIILEKIKTLGSAHGLSPGQVQYLTLKEVEELLVSDCETDIRQSEFLISSRKQYQEHITRLMNLPMLICDESAVDVVPFQVAQPNFVTSLVIDGELVCLEKNPEIAADELRGKIIMIEAADPGYDWLFSCNISGLLTKHGGANSHMTIRCAELAVPAAIGIGEKLYSEIMQWENVLLNCAERKIEQRELIR